VAIFEWNDGNLHEIANHRVSAAEAEEAFGNPRRQARVGVQRSGEWRGVLVSATRAGRVLVVVYTRRAGAIRIITAYPATGGALRRYQGR
jgi:uncharacterized protein